MKLKTDKVLDIEIQIPNGPKISTLTLVTKIEKNKLILEPMGAIVYEDTPEPKRVLTVTILSVEMEAIETTSRDDYPWRSFTEGVYNYEAGVIYPDGDQCTLKFAICMPKKKRKGKHILESKLRKYLNNYTGEIKMI